MHKSIQKLSLLIGVLLFTITGSIPAFAAEDFAINVAPLILEMDLNPGETVTKSVKLSNRSDSSITLDMETVDFYYDAEGEIQFIKLEEPEDTELQKFSMREWISAEEIISLKAKETKEIKLTISIPEDSTPGGHYGMAVFGQTNRTGEGEGVAIGLGGQIGVMILVTVPGEFSEEGGLEGKLQTGVLSEDLKTFNPKKTFTGDGLSKIGPVGFSFTFKNNSASHIKPQGYIVVKNIFGADVGMFSIYEKRIFPGTSRNIYARLEKNFLIGPYKAYLDVTDPEGNHYSSEVSFLALPWKIMLMMFLGIAAIIIFFKFYNKWLIDRALKKRK